MTTIEREKKLIEQSHLKYAGYNTPYSDLELLFLNTLNDIENNMLKEEQKVIQEEEQKTKFEIFDFEDKRLYIDYKNHLEFLTTKNNTINDPWIINISTQLGCKMNCQFCDCPQVSFLGNVSEKLLDYQIKIILADKDVTIPFIDKIYIYYDRLGEPTFNKNIIFYSMTQLLKTIHQYSDANIVYPTITTMLPAKNKNLRLFLTSWCKLKNSYFQGNCGLQFTINSTDDEQRQLQFANQSLNLKDISILLNDLPAPIKDKYTLNFIITQNTILDEKKLSLLFDKNKFMIQLIPIYPTLRARKNNLYSEKLQNIINQFYDLLNSKNWDVFITSDEKINKTNQGNILLNNNFI